MNELSNLTIQLRKYRRIIILNFLDIFPHINNLKKKN